MKQVKLIQSLYMADMSTAQKIMQHYPPQWDMERIFQKAYKRHLIQKLESTKREMVISAAIKKK